MNATSWTIFGDYPELGVYFQDLVNLVHIWRFVRLYLLKGLQFFKEVLCSLISVYQVGLKVHSVNLEYLYGHSTVTLWPRIASGMLLASGVSDILS